MPIEGISVIGRNTQGVKLIDILTDERVIGAARLAEKDANEDEVEDTQDDQT
jgi:DNA gyrase subunit A